MAARLHTNNVVGYFSIFKRGLVDTHRHMSEQHLERYPAKFDFRISHRTKPGYSDDLRIDKAPAGIGELTKPLTPRKRPSVFTIRNLACPGGFIRHHDGP
jgi:hypothetical protein